ncbi:DUF6531 domain-containing protein [Streptomyces sp. NPDC001914]|uniref:DUF6531 domain-containing protein n=1 Tax=Streptomyces sp. NPDC001914 TaxID=3364623 RepID=UPI00368A01EF
MAGNRPGDWHVLDLERDPTPGDPDRVRKLSKDLLDFADDVSDALRLIKGMAGEDAVLAWAGKSAEAFQAEFSGVPKQLKKLKKSYEMAGGALGEYWPKLERAQALADKALVKGREAQADLSSAKSRLASADSWVTRAGKEADKYKDDPTGSKDAEKPDEAKVRAATRDAQHAKSAQTSARSDVTDANSALDAAKKMAADARKMREEAARDAKSKIDEASDAGIRNRKWWEEVGDWFSDNWDTIVTVCKVVVAVLGIVAMIIGGPILGAIVLIAALVVLADTLNKYAKGQASLWDVGFAALDCIPGMKGLTTLGGLAKGLKGLKAFGKTGLKGMALGAKGFGKSARSLGRPMKKLFTCGDPIDMATGQMVMSETDVALDGVLPLVLERHHRTGLTGGRHFGRAWSSTLDQRLVLDATGVRFFAADGMILTYPVPEPDVPVLPVEGPHWPLSWDGGPGGTLTVSQSETGRTLSFRPREGRPPQELPLAAIGDRNDNTITVEYAADGSPAEIVHHGGYRVGVACASGRVVSLTLLSDPARPTLMTYGYDPHGRLTEVRNSSGRPLKLAYDDRGRLTGWEDRNGAWYRYTYDDGGRCVAVSGVHGILDYTFDYDDERHLTRAVSSLGHTTVYRFNDAYQLIAETDALGHTEFHEWNRRDQRTSHTDRLGQVTRMEWDDLGRLTEVALPDGAVSAARYNAQGLTVELTGYDGTVVRQEWDERGNCTSLTDTDGTTTEFTRDRTGAVASVTDPLGAVQRFVNNPAGQIVSASDALGAETRFGYDAFGRVTSVVDPVGEATRQEWTVEGHLAARTGPDGSTEAWTYDGEGNRLTHTDALGRVTRFEYGAFDLLTARTTPDGARYAFRHDSELRLCQVTDPRGLTWDYTYDAVGSPTSETDFDGRTVHYAYDAARRLTGRTNPLGQSTTFAYDAVGNQVEKTVDGRTTVFTHTPGGRLLRAVGPDATLTLRYDEAGRIAGEAVDGRELATSYDAAGRPVRRVTPAGATTTYTYDNAGNRTALSASGHLLTSSYDAAGRETARAFGPGLTLGFAWDTGDRLGSQTLEDTRSSRRPLRRTYTYRADGNLTGIDDPAAGRRTFDLDVLGQVTAVRAADWTESYAYDGTGNVTGADWPAYRDQPEARGTRSYAGNRLVGAGSVHYEYDDAGRVILRRRTRLSRKPDVWRYSWDAEDRLVGVTTPDGTRWHYLHDALGRRVAKRRLAADGVTVAEETRFVWDGPHLVEQTSRVAGADGGAVRETTLTWERDDTRPLTQTERTTLAGAPQDVVDERFFAIVTDLVGTPTELVDETGAIVWRGDTTLWGLGTLFGPGPGTAPGSGASTPLRFPGQYHDAETGLHHNFFRHYDPASAVYLSPDPLGMDAGPNPRRYVVNPLLWSDYLGLKQCSKILGENMAKEGRAVGPGQAAAHIVPSGFSRGGGPRMRSLLAKYKVDINDAANGIPLGHPRPHNFTHSNRFLGRLDAHLHNVVADRVARGFGDRAIRTTLRRELRSIGRQIESELSGVTTAVPSTAYWTA